MVRKTKRESKSKSLQKVLKPTVKKTCELCKTDNPHMICILNKNGDIHVHGPFNELKLVKQFQKAIRVEVKKRV